MSALSAVIVSGHDYRTAVRASMHPIAEALADLGHAVRFVSVGYSFISWLKKDRRSRLWRSANRAKLVNGIECYLWRTLFHPVNPDIAGLNQPATFAYHLYSRYPNQYIDDALRSASVVIVESGLGVLLISRARALNKAVRIIYLASDDLATIGAHPVLQLELEACAPIIEHVCITSASMAPKFAWAGDKLFVVPHGLNPADFDVAATNPYDRARNAVSVGSMLFDPDFFTHAATIFPDVTFHVIGSASACAFPPNVRLYSEMPFKDTVGYLRHAAVGVAPYRLAPGCEYLSDTSMKLMQFDFLGLPAVCPHFAVGDNPNRFGYMPGDRESIRLAMTAAMQRGRPIVGSRYPTWREVALRLLDPTGPGS